jgi:putative oxidoreductase
MLTRLIHTTSDKSIVIIRLLVGCVFLSEGIQKFLFPEILGTGRLEKNGFPAADFLGPFVGTLEILCGILLIIGLFTRLASLVFISIMLVALATTKSEVFIQKGFWELLHSGRTDWSMLLGSIFLLVKGSGFYSIDYNYVQRKSNDSDYAQA